MGIEGITLTAAIFGAVAGVLGAVLGILNTYRNFKRDKVKLKILLAEFESSPTLVISDGTVITIEVLKLSEFPVTVKEIGLGSKNGEWVPRLALWKGPLQGEGVSLPPYRLEPRSSCYMEFSSLDEDWREVVHAFARTQCGTTATSKGQYLRSLKRRAQEGYIRPRRSLP